VAKGTCIIKCNMGYTCFLLLLFLLLLLVSFNVYRVAAVAGFLCRCPRKIKLKQLISTKQPISSKVYLKCLNTQTVDNPESQ